MKKYSYEKAIINLLMFLGPVLAPTLNVLHVLLISFTPTKERIDCQGSLVKNRYNLAIIIPVERRTNP